MFLVRRLPSRSLLSRTLPFRTLVALPFSCSMSTDKSDAQKDITKWASNDGHFRRQVSSFRDLIEEGGKFEPEKGERRRNGRMILMKY